MFSLWHGQEVVICGLSSYRMDVIGDVDGEGFVRGYYTYLAA